MWTWQVLLECRKGDFFRTERKQGLAVGSRTKTVNGSKRDRIGSMHLKKYHIEN
jgi:hypothetical protein